MDHALTQLAAVGKQSEPEPRLATLPGFGRSIGRSTEDAQSPVRRHI